jgi:hypothetical protein
MKKRAIIVCDRCDIHSEDETLFRKCTICEDVICTSCYENAFYSELTRPNQNRCDFIIYDSRHLKTEKPISCKSQYRMN